MDNTKLQLAIKEFIKKTKLNAAYFDENWAERKEYYSPSTNKAFVIRKRWQNAFQ